MYSSGRIYSSVFFGGGTPSLMMPVYIEDIINHLRSYFNISSSAEITLETNPGTVDLEKLKHFFQSGINRISIGIQSFDENELKFLTRIHDKITAVNTVLNAEKAGFENISVDLIFNLPGQTKKGWKNNLEIALSLPIKHISTYSLILERGTILNKMVLDGKVKLQDEDYDADLYELTIDILTSKGFNQYEVSNFSQPGYECIHNLAYWRYRDYISFGTSAHSFMDGKRWWNFSSLKKYINEIEKNSHAAANYEILTEKQMFDEYVMLALRSSGLDLIDLKKKFGGGWINNKNDYFNLLVDENLITMNDGWIKLTKKGYAVCDEILNNIL